MNEFTWPNEESSQIYQYLFMEPPEYAPVAATRQEIYLITQKMISEAFKRLETADAISMGAETLRNQFPHRLTLDATAGWKERLLAESLGRVDWELVMIALLHG